MKLEDRAHSLGQAAIVCAVTGTGVLIWGVVTSTVWVSMAGLVLYVAGLLLAFLGLFAAVAARMRGRSS